MLVFGTHSNFLESAWVWAEQLDLKNDNIFAEENPARVKTTIQHLCWALTSGVFAGNCSLFVLISTNLNQFIPLPWRHFTLKTEYNSFTSCCFDVGQWWQGSISVNVISVLHSERPVAKSSHIPIIFPQRHVSSGRELLIVSQDFLQELWSVHSHWL